MNFNFKTLTMLLASGALVLTSCNDDMLDASKAQQQYDGNYFHVVAGVALPTAGGTRSQTDDGDWSDGEGNDNTNSSGTTTNGSNDQGDENKDFEYGYGYENEIRSMILVFTDPDYKYVCHSIVNGITYAPDQKPTDAYNLTVKAELKTDDLEKAYGQDGVLSGSGEKIVHVFAFCNPTFDLLSKFDGDEPIGDDWINWMGSVEEAGADVGVKPAIQNTIWAKRSFFMSNAKIATIKFPKDMVAWGNFADKEHPYILNNDGLDEDGKNISDTPDPIYVERAAARLDFKDGSPKDTEKNTYPIMLDINGNGQIDQDGDLNIISVHLNRMCLVNMSKNFYYLRRVSDGKVGSDTELCGKETSVNGKTPYVVDTDWETKATPGGYKRDNVTTSEKGKGFNFAFYSEHDPQEGDIEEGQVDDTYYNRFAWYVDRIDDVLDNGRESDTWGNNEYKIWRYVTENTIPLNSEGKTSQQKTIQSTGIVFKGAIVPGKDMLQEGSTADNPVFTENAKKYMSEAAMQAILDINNEKVVKNDNPNSPDYYGNTAHKLFSFENQLYAGVADILSRAAEEGAGSPLWNAVSQVLYNWVVEIGTTEVNGKQVPTYTYKYKPEDKTTGQEKRLDATIAQNIITNDQKGYVNCFIEGLEYTDDEDGNRTVTSMSDTNFVKHAPDSQIAIYRPFNEEDGDGWGYYCYYVYWNRHNDNLKSGMMGQNEFATVRNNVYKLSVTAINKLGHPRVREYDPDPFDPEDPDEDATQFLQVNVEVLPWVVRVNNIEF